MLRDAQNTSRQTTGANGQGSALWQLDAECGSQERAPRGALAPRVNAAPGDSSEGKTQKATSLVPF